MAYASQERKKTIMANLKKVMPPKWWWTVRVLDHTTFVLTIRALDIDLIGEWAEVQRQMHESEARINLAHVERALRDYHLDLRHYMDAESFPVSHQLVSDIKEAMYSADWYDHSDSQSDYFNYAYRVDIQIGSSERPATLMI